MAKTDFQTADAYIATFDSGVQATLQKIRKTIREAVPGAEEVISYQLPAYRLQGGWIFYFGAYKDHYALSCPPPFTVFEAFKKELAEYEVSKSAIRFPKDKPVPFGLIAKMAKYRAEER